MTCQKADKLMQDVLNGEVDEECAVGLREHLGDCERCADAWHAVWQVRSMLTECESPDPGEPYLQQATSRIMDRIAALQTRKTVPEEPPIISTTRYGPLSVRGVGAAFVFALSVFAGSLFSGSGEAGTPAGRGLRNAGWLPAPAFHPVPDHGLSWRDPNHYHADGRHNDGPRLAVKPRIQAPNRSDTITTDERGFRRWEAPPPTIYTPQPSMCH